MNSKARLIITFDCNRRCIGCCNTYVSLINQSKSIYSIDDLAKYETIIITGGEPNLYPANTYELILKIKQRYPIKKIYLYTAYYTPDMQLYLSLIDGIHFTLHNNLSEKDIKEFYSFQRHMELYYKKLSLRLYIDNRITESISILPYLYSRVESKAWIPEGNCPLPEGEELLVWKGEYK